MSSPSKQKGTAGESAVVTYLRPRGFPQAERRALAGSTDKGDILVCPGIILEVKNYTLRTGFPSQGQLDKWMAEAETERRNAGALYCPLVVKRRGTTNVGDWFVFAKDHPEGWYMTTVSQWVLRMRRQGYGNALPVEV